MPAVDRKIRPKTKFPDGGQAICLIGFGRSSAQPLKYPSAFTPKPAMTYAAPSFESKVCPPDQLATKAAQLARPLVFTNGCFDILHRGHVTYLAQAAALGTSLVVALNSDASVKRLGKGDDRPVNALADRLAVIASLGCVALVTWFDEDTPIERILECRPEILVKGGDWPVEKIVGCNEVRGWGGTVHSIPFIHQKSTTALLEKIRRL